MFTWYSNAEICYADLSDVGTEVSEELSPVYNQRPASEQYARSKGAWQNSKTGV